MRLNKKQSQQLKNHRSTRNKQVINIITLGGYLFDF